MILGLLVVLVSSPIALTWYIHKHTSHNSFPIGMKAPSFVVSTINGTTFSLGYNGKKQIIIFFTAECSSCRDELSNLNKLYEQYKTKVNFFAISMSQLENTKILMSSQKIPFSVFLWTRTASQDSLKISDVPTLLFVDEQRIIRNEYIGNRALTEDKTLIQSFCEEPFTQKR